MPTSYPIILLYIVVQVAFLSSEKNSVSASAKRLGSWFNDDVGKKPHVIIVVTILYEAYS